MSVAVEFVDWSFRRAAYRALGTMYRVPGPETLRICVGAGEVAPDDWLCIDRLPGYPDRDESVDPTALRGRVRGDVRDLSWLPDGCASVVYAHHVIEHIPVNDWAETLRGWARLLAPDGVLYACQPDLEPIAARILEASKSGSAAPWFNADRAARTFTGDDRKMDLAGLGDRSAWLWLYLGGDHLSVPCMAHFVEVLEPLGYEVRKARFDLNREVEAPYRWASAMEGCYVIRRR